jgi:hypothetical protein
MNTAVFATSSVYNSATFLSWQFPAIMQLRHP